ncbi:putative diguanylate cyclase AdrA [Clostridiales bacterium CHKCI006]|nr:putative diguanylate cyclase AdrA [Clostridiales bacterium CHKCI006]
MDHLAKTTFDSFLSAFFVERNITKALSFVLEDVLFLGTEIHEIALNKEEMLPYLEKAMQRYQHSFSYQKLSDCVLSFASPNNCHISGLIECTQIASLSTYQVRIVADLVKTTTWQIAYLHFTGPVALQASPELETHPMSETQTNPSLISLAFNLFPCGIMGNYMNEDYRFYMINEEMLAYLGYEDYADFIQATSGQLANVISVQDRDRVFQSLREQLCELDEFEVRCRLVRKDQTAFWAYIKGRKVVIRENQQALVSVAIDVSDFISIQEVLQKEASEDDLTGIYNRRQAILMIENSFRHYDRGALCILDVDNFKSVNDQYGHQEGDSLLIGIANLLKKHVRQNDVIARLGGDEFLIYFIGMTERATVEKRVHEFQREFESLVKDCYEDLNLSISAGIGMREHYENFDQLYQMADMALYETKRNKKRNTNSILFGRRSF